MTKKGKPDPLDSRFRGNDIWGAGSRFCGNDKNNGRGARRRARRKSERGGRAPRRQGETAQTARRQRAGTAQPARRQSKETQSGSEARETRQGAAFTRVSGSRRLVEQRGKTSAALALGAGSEGFPNLSRILRSNVGSRQEDRRRRSVAKVPKGFAARGGRRRRWLPEPPRKPEGSEARGARPRPERSEGLRIAKPRRKTSAARALDHGSAGFPSRQGDPKGLRRLRRQTAGLPSNVRGDRPG